MGPKDDRTTRPITDRVKENVFNRLQSLGVLGEGVVLDIFSGTGSLGLEALSRGAEHGFFVEQDPDATARLIQNLADLGLKDRATLLNTSALTPAWVHRLDDASVNLAFIDPPYRLLDEVTAEPVFAQLFASLLPKMQDGGVAIWRCREDQTPPEPDGYDGPLSRTYGSMAIHLFQKPLEEDPGDADDGVTFG